MKLENEKGSFYYQIEGPEDAPVLVLLHGVAMDGRTFDSQIKRLSSRYRILTFDMPFHGKSSKLAYTLPYSKTTADLLLDIMDREGIDRAVFAGVSMGSFIVQKVAESNPLRVIATVHISGGPIDQKFSSALKACIPFLWLLMAWPKKLLDKSFAKHKALKEPTKEYLRETMRTMSKRTIIHLMKEMILDMTQGLDKSPSQPMCLFLGDHDIRFILKMNKKWHQRVAHSKLVTIKDAHHIVNQDQPEAFVDALESFLSDLPDLHAAAP